MRYPDSVEYLYRLGNEIKSAKFGLENITQVLRALGDPQLAFPVVHVAGTNGKGSTCAMIEAAARAAGRCTGLYTSPHLVEPVERIRRNGEPVSREDFAAAFNRVHAVGLQMETHPTYFETVTAMGFLLFRDWNVDLAVVEVGMGGRLDATNLVKPEVAVIAPVDFDHELFLGSSLQQIAGEKAGILKPGSAAVIAPQRPEAEAVIRGAAGRLGIQPDFLQSQEMKNLLVSPYDSAFEFRGERVLCPLAGSHQSINAATAATTLQRLGIPVSGIEKAHWPGRLEIISRAPDLILDGAHNPAGARALATHIRQFYAGRTVWLIYGAMRDKSVQEITEILFPVATHVVVTAPQFERALRPEAVAAASDHPSIHIAADLKQALRIIAAAGPDDAVFLTGSLYLVGEARALLVK